MGVRVASEWLNSCLGCEISIIDMVEPADTAATAAAITAAPIAAIVAKKEKGKEKLPPAQPGVIANIPSHKKHLRNGRLKSRISVSISAGK